MSIDIELQVARDIHGICAIHADAIIMYSPREGFDADKLAALERDLSSYIEDRLNDAVKKGGAK
jgi:hypothetical protein